VCEFPCDFFEPKAHSLINDVMRRREEIAADKRRGNGNGKSIG
jgi:hypothetical protein